MYTSKMRASHKRLGAGRRNYELIAFVINNMPRKLQKEIASYFIEECASHSGFDKTRFLRACGL